MEAVSYTHLKLFEHMPGQCAMVCAPGVSEGMFSITSSPTNKEYQEFSIKTVSYTHQYVDRNKRRIQT